MVRWRFALPASAQRPTRSHLIVTRRNTCTDAETLSLAVSPVSLLVGPRLGGAGRSDLMRTGAGSGTGRGSAQQLQRMDGHESSILSCWFLGDGADCRKIQFTWFLVPRRRFGSNSIIKQCEKPRESHHPTRLADWGPSEKQTSPYLTDATDDVGELRIKIKRTGWLKRYQISRQICTKKDSKNSSNSLLP